MKTEKPAQLPIVSVLKGDFVRKTVVVIVRRVDIDLKVVDVKVEYAHFLIALAIMQVENVILTYAKVSLN